MTELDRLTLVVRDGESVANGNGHAVPTFARTDMGNGYRFAHHFGHIARYCSEDEKWRVYDGTRWVPDITQQIYRYAKETVSRILVEADDAQSLGEQSDLTKHAFASQNVARLNAMLKVAQSEIPVTLHEFDSDPWLFNVVNGTLDLRTGALRPHNRDDLITKRSPVVYEPKAECPMWLEFLARCVPSERLIAFLQRWFGYCMTAFIHEHAFVFAWGPGANGKSVTTNVIEHVMGDYAQPTQPETIMRRERKDLSNDVAMLMGARFVPTQEVEEGARFQEGLVKQLTGGDKVTARRLYEDFITFRPTFKLWIAGNDKPLVGNGKAIWRRLLLVPFIVEIPKEEQDELLEDKLKTESAGILNWILEGCRQWQETGLAPPPEVKTATDEYRREVDVLGHFLSDRCVAHDKASVLASDLYEAYTEWCGKEGSKPLSQTRFGLAIVQRGFLRGREDRASRRAIYRGVGLLNPTLEGLEGLEDFPRNIAHFLKEEEISGKPLQPLQDSLSPDVDEEEI